MFVWFVLGIVSFGNVVRMLYIHIEIVFTIYVFSAEHAKGQMWN